MNNELTRLRMAFKSTVFRFNYDNRNCGQIRFVCYTCTLSQKDTFFKHSFKRCKFPPNDDADSFYATLLNTDL